MRIADKCEEAVGVRVERAVGIQSKPPPVQPTPNTSSWRFGNLERSKDRSKASRPSTSGGGVSERLEPAEREGVGFTVNGDRV